MNNKFKAAIFEDFGTQTNAAKALRMHPSVISILIRDHRGPTAGERAQLRKHFSAYRLKRFFDKRAEKVEGDEAINQ